MGGEGLQEADQDLTLTLTRWEEWLFKKLTLLSGLGRAYLKELGNQHRQTHTRSTLTLYPLHPSSAQPQA